MPSRDEPTSVNARQPSAVKNAASPISDTAWPGPEHAKVAVAERVEDAHALQRSRFGLHRPKLSSRLVLDLEAAAERWSLTLGEPYEPGVDGYTTRADACRTARPPCSSSCIRTARASTRRTRCEPGTATARCGCSPATRAATRCCSSAASRARRSRRSTPDAALDVVIGLLPRLWKPAGEPFHSLADEAAWWAAYLPEQDWSGEPDLLAAALDAIETLSPTQGEQVLLHQDLHFGQRARGRARAVARHRPEAARRRARVRRRRRSFARTSSGTRSATCCTASTASPPSSGSTASARAAGRSRRPSRGRRTAASTERHVETARWLLEAA